jgi:hypothetical protein
MYLHAKAVRVSRRPRGFLFALNSLIALVAARKGFRVRAVTSFDLPEMSKPSRFQNSGDARGSVDVTVTRSRPVRFRCGLHSSERSGLGNIPWKMVVITGVSEGG